MKTEFTSYSANKNYNEAIAALTANGFIKDGYYWRNGVNKAILDVDQPISVFIAHTVDGKWSWEN